MKNVFLTLVISLALTAYGCAGLSRPVTEREQTAAMGGLAGGAGGAIIGSLAGGAVAGGLFGMPIGAVAGWLAGDYMAREDRLAQTRVEEREAELNRLRSENQRLRNENGDRPGRGGQVSSREQRQETKSSAQPAPISEQNITSSPRALSESQQAPTNAQQDAAKSQSSRASPPQQAISPAQLRQAQRKLNDMGFNAGQVDGVWGPNTQAAIGKFQQAKNLEATGRLNEQTIEALGIEADGSGDAQQSYRQKEH
ncbi:MAG: peptidoglycan-binding protein [Candidatus Binatia bacterium]